MIIFIILLIDSYSLIETQMKTIISSSNFEFANNNVIQELSGCTFIDTTVPNHFDYIKNSVEVIIIEYASKYGK